MKSRKKIFFPILTDEAADVSNLEQLALVLRFVDQSAKTRKDFLGFFHCDEGLSGFFFHFCLDQLRDEIQTGNKQLLTAHINVNGILTRNKLTEIKILLDKTKIDCLGITETKLNKNDSDESLKIEGYKIIRQDRTRNSGGGCLLYYKEHLHCQPQRTLSTTIFA